MFHHSGRGDSELDECRRNPILSDPHVEQEAYDGSGLIYGIGQRRCTRFPIRVRVAERTGWRIGGERDVDEFGLNSWNSVPLNASRK